MLDYGNSDKIFSEGRSFSPLHQFPFPKSKPKSLASDGPSSRGEQTAHKTTENDVRAVPNS
jgi:hypothetical protein